VELCTKLDITLLPNSRWESSYDLFVCRESHHQNENTMRIQMLNKIKQPVEWSSNLFFQVHQNFVSKLI